MRLQEPTPGQAHSPGLALALTQLLQVQQLGQKVPQVPSPGQLPVLAFMYSGGYSNLAWPKPCPGLCVHW